MLRSCISPCNWTSLSDQFAPPTITQIKNPDPGVRGPCGPRGNAIEVNIIIQKEICQWLNTMISFAMTWCKITFTVKSHNIFLIWNLDIRATTRDSEQHRTPHTQTIKFFKGSIWTFKISHFPLLLPILITLLILQPFKIFWDFTLRLLDTYAAKIAKICVL